MWCPLPSRIPNCLRVWTCSDRAPEIDFPELAVAIDTYVLQEKPLLLCLDPWCEADAQFAEPAFEQKPQPTSSQFDAFHAWG